MHFEPLPRRASELHAAAECFHATLDPLEAEAGLDHIGTAPIVARTQCNLERLTLDRDPQVAGRTVSDGVGRHFLHRLEKNAGHLRLQSRKWYRTTHMQPRLRQILRELQDLALEIDRAIFLRIL